MKISVITPLFLIFFSVSDCRDQSIKFPNVIIIFMDDMGYGDLESFGATGYTTPYTNKMAAEGMRFTQFYTPSAVCSASRAAILTGCYPNRVGIPGALFPTSTIALNPEEETLAEILKKKGYATGMVGKWHLGDKVPFLPLQHGFDEYLGLPYSNDMWPVEYDGVSITDPTHRKFKNPPLPLIEGNKVFKNINTLEEQSLLTSLYTKRALQFIKKNRENPFFLYVAHTMPHVPIAASKKFSGKSEEGTYGDVMMELDWSVGEILKTLDENGLSENTLVILTSDNGPWLNYGNHAGSNGGFREGKSTSFEGGVRIPAIARWKGKIPAGSVNNHLASTIDLLPTIINLCGAELPLKEIDGVDISSLLLNEGGAPPRDHLAFYYQENSLEAVRKGFWKLVFPQKHRTYYENIPGFNGWPGEISTDSISLSLYNLRIDPGETINLKEKFPEVVLEIQKVADQYRKELGDDLTGHPGPERRAPATVERNTNE